MGEKAERIKVQGKEEKAGKVQKGKERSTESGKNKEYKIICVSVMLPNNWRGT